VKITISKRFENVDKNSSKNGLFKTLILRILLLNDGICNVMSAEIDLNEE
jgi:hypothetical protein